MAIAVQLGLTPKGPGPVGAVSQFRDHGRLRPSGGRRLGVINTQPTIQFFELHNYFTPLPAEFGAGHIAGALDPDQRASPLAVN